jgi:preprotein translocase subunit SecA
LQHADAVSPIRAAAAATAPNTEFGAPLEPASAPLASRDAPPFIRNLPKVGRNEPCPCGSGRKYKHCHGALQANG